MPESVPALVVEFFTRTGVTATGGQFDFERCTRKMFVHRNRKRDLLVFLYLRRKYKKRERQYWIYPILAVRYLEGSFYTLFEKLESHDSKFLKTAIRLFFRKPSFFFKLLIPNKLHIPPSGPLFTNVTATFPFVFVGDEALSLSENLMRPYAGHNLSEKQRIFNYRLCRARRYVECAFGILSNKWRILHTALNVSKEFSKDIVKACVLVHNLVRSKDWYRSEEKYI